jgi:hypothetical protein
MCHTTSVSVFSKQAPPSRNQLQLAAACDFHKLIRQRKGLHATTIPSDTDRVQVCAVEVGAAVRGSGEYVSVDEVVKNSQSSQHAVVQFVAKTGYS